MDPVFKIVETDNFGRDYPDERFILWAMPFEDAEAIVEILNRRVPYNRFFRIVPDDYVLAPGFEP